MPEDNDLFDENLAKLLRGAHGPPQMDPGRKQLALAELRNQFRRAKSAQGSTMMKRWTRGLACAAAVAAVVAGFVLIPGLWRSRPNQPQRPEVKPASDGQFADGTRIYARPGAEYTVVGERHVRLDSGQILLFVAKSDKPFLVDTPQGQAKARGTVFTVSAGQTETFVAVGQGRVDLTNAKGLVEIRPGQQALADVDRRPRRTAAPRFSHLVNWARKHLGGEKLFKPDKARATGELVAVDPWGRDVQLELREYKVDVVIEDGIARTTVDQTYFNHLTWQIEGTFYFPLPPDASLSRLAMYVNGTLNEGGMVERNYGRYVYESIVYRRRDPALLEMMEGNVFKMRVFPIFGRKEKRILISYTQTLPELYRTMRYWFPMERTSRKAGHMAIRVRVKNAAGKLEALSSTHKIKACDDAGDLLIEHHAENVAPSRDFLLRLTPQGAGGPELTVTRHKQDGCNYVFARWRPQLRGAADGRPRQWFIINDVSASRSSVDVKAQAYVIDRLLAEADDEDGFALVNLDTRPVPWRDELIGVRDPQAVSASAFTAPAERMGATNIRAALAMVSDMIRRSGADNPHVVYLGDGIATDGVTATNELVSALPAKSVFIGLGVGKKIDARFLQAAADASGGLFAPINPNEDIRWRMFDMVASLNTPRLVNLQVTFVDAAGKPMAVQAYPSSGVVSDGEALTVLARADEVMPSGMTVRGLSTGGATVTRDFTFDRPRDGAAYIPRLWAAARINYLLAKDALGNKAEIVNLSKYYYVVTPFTSLIVLENEADYKKWNVEMGRKDHWQLYPAPKKIKVIHEPLPGGRWDIPAAPLKGKPGHPKSIEEIVQSVQFRTHVPLYGYYRHQRYRGRMERFQLQSLLSGRLPAVGGGAGLLLPVQGWDDENEEISGFGAMVGTSPGDIPPVLGTGLDGRWKRLPGLVAADGLRARGNLEYRGFGLNDDSYLLPNGLTPGYYSIVGDGSSNQLSVRGTWGPATGKQLRGGRLGMGAAITELDLFETLPQLLLDRTGQGQGQGQGGEAAFARIGSLLGGKLREERRFGSSIVDEDLSTRYSVLANSYFRPLGRDDLGPENGRELRQAQFGRWKEDRQRIRQYNRRYGGWYYGDWDMDDDRRRVSGITSLAVTFETLSRTVTADPTELPRGTRNAEIPPPVVLRPPTTTPMPPVQLRFYARTVGAVPGTLSTLTADRLLPLREKLQAMEPSEKRDKALAAIDGFVKNLPQLSAGTESTGVFWLQHGAGALPQRWDFLQPQCQAWAGSRAMVDLTRYAPALESTWADIAEVVLAAFGKKPRGRVDEKAATRIAAARGKLPTMRVKYLSKKGKVLFELWAGSGDRFAWTRRSSMYLREDFVCDGKALHHVYPELGLAARRTTAPRRIAALRGLTPHVLPPADQLARSFNVQLAKSDGPLTTIRLTPTTPRKKAKPAVLVTFDDRGFLRKQVWQVDGEAKLTCSYTYEDSRVQCTWKTPEKTLADFAYQCEVAKAPGSPLAAKLDGIVVLDMPLRRSAHYAALLKEAEKDPPRRMRIRRHMAMAQLQEHVWQSPWGQAAPVYQTMLVGLKERAAAGQKTVLAGDLAIIGSTGYAHSIGAQAKDLQLPTEHPLWTYWRKQGDAARMKKLAEDHPGGFVGHLATHALTHRGGNVRVAAARRMMKDYADSPLLYAAATYCGSNEDVWLELAKNPRWRVLALLTAAQRKPTIKVAEAFDALDREMAEKGWQVPVSARMVAALKLRGALWQGVVKRRLAAAAKSKDVAALLQLAELAWPHGEKDLAAKALDQARKLIGKKLPLTWKLALTHSLTAMGRTQEAWDLHKQVLAAMEKKGLAPSPALLGLSARLAQQAGQNDQAFDFELKAIEAERPYMPKRVNVHLFRRRYQWLWSRLTQRIQKCTTDADKKHALARAKIVWETWKRVDTANSVDLYGRLAALYRLAGDNAAAWRVVSSVIDEKPKDGSSYYSVGRWHVNHGQRDAGQQWYAKAYQVEPTNGDWVWHRAQLLSQMGRKKDAEALYKEIAAKKWQPRFQHYNSRAKKALGKLKSQG